MYNFEYLSYVPIAALFFICFNILDKGFSRISTTLTLGKNKTQILIIEPKDLMSDLFWFSVPGKPGLFCWENS